MFIDLESSEVPHSFSSAMFVTGQQFLFKPSPTFPIFVVVGGKTSHSSGVRNFGTFEIYKHCTPPECGSHIALLDRATVSSSNPHALTSFLVRARFNS